MSQKEFRSIHVCFQANQALLTPSCSVAIVVVTWALLGRLSFLLQEKNVELEMIDQIDSVSLKSILNNKLKDKMLVHAL